MTVDPSSALKQAEDLVRFLHAHLTDEEPPGTEWDGMWFSRQEDGSLFLTAEEAVTYWETVDALRRAVDDPEQVSQRTVESWLQDAILACLDLTERRRTDQETGLPITFDDRLTIELGKLSSRLTKPATAWEVWHPVEGFTVGELPIQFGPIEVAVLEGAAWDAVTDVVSRHMDANTVMSATEKETAKQTYRDRWLADIRGAVAARCVVHAHDADAAISQVRHRLRIVLDVINFIGHENVFNRNLRSQVRLPEVGSRTVTTTIAHSEGELLSVPRSVHGPMRALELKDVAPPLVDAASAAAGAALPTQPGRLSKKKASRLAQSIPALLTTAMSWAGRADVSERPVDALLFYMIALESIMLSPSEATESTYKLALRISNLLAVPPSQKRDVVQRASRLYGVRSRVVHNGDYRVLPSDVGAARYFAHKCIGTLLLSDHLSESTTADDLRQYLDGLVLGLTPPMSSS